MSTTNCVNCGAPATGIECGYCGTKADSLDPEADLPGFEELLSMVRSQSWDDDKVETIETFTTRARVLTAGQVRAVLAEFRWDDDRLEAAKLLVPTCSDPKRLLHCGDVFRWPEERTAFFRVIVGDRAEVRRGLRRAVAVGPAETSATSAVVEEDPAFAIGLRMAALHAYQQREAAPEPGIFRRALEELVSPPTSYIFAASVVFLGASLLCWAFSGAGLFGWWLAGG